MRLYEKLFKTMFPYIQQFRYLFYRLIKIKAIFHVFTIAKIIF